MPPVLVRQIIHKGYTTLSAHFSALGVRTFASALSVFGVGKNHPPFADELRGLAQHAGVSYEQLLLLNLSYEISSNWISIPGAQGCTSAIRFRPNGNVIIRAMDWDFPEGIRKHVCIVRYLTAAHTTLSVGYPGFVGAVTGVTSAGVAACLNQAFGSEKRVTPLPVSWAVRNMLTECLTVEDARTYLACTRTAAGGFYLLADRRAGYLVESTGDFDVTHELDPVKGYLAVANHFSEEQPPQVREWGDSHARLAAMEQRVRSGMSDRKTLQYAPILHGGTAHTVVIDLAQSTLSVRVPYAKNKKWHRCRVTL